MTRGAIPVLGILLIGSAFLANAEPANLSPATTAESPLELLTAGQKDYLYVKTFEERRTAAEDANDTYDRLFCYGSPVELKWTGTTGTCTVEVKRTSDGKVVWTGTTDGLSVTVYNLELGADYEWTVTDSTGAAASARFRTSGQPPRLIKTGQVRMLRDLGGWTGTLDGRQYRVRQNLIFRGAAVDDPKATGTQPPYLIEDDSDRDFFYNVVRLKNEVDLRNLNNTTGSSPDLTSAAKQSGQYMLDPTGEHVTYNNCPFTASSALSASGGFFAALKLLLNPDKLPAYFHCKSGRDRTGMVGAFLLALLGVSRDDIIRDYQTTSDQNNWSKYGFSTFLDTSLGQYQRGTTSLAENARAFLLNNGITDGQIETFRETMLEGYGEPPSPTFAVTPYLQNPSSDAMTIIFFTTGPCEATVTCQRHDADATFRRVLTETTVGVWAEALTNNAYQLKQGVEKNTWKDSLHRHRVRFEGLEPNRTYDYTVTLADGTAYSNAFRTAPDRDTPIRFVSYADSETTSSTFANYTANLNRMKNHDPDLITSAGDLVARGGIQSYWDEFWMQNAGGNGIGRTDVLGSIPMLTAIGNHDLFDNVAHDAKNGFYHDAQGEFATEKFLAYFEHNPNGVPYAYRDGTNQTETRDMSQLFHREDFGPVTLIFLDSNNGQDGDTDDDHDRDSNYCKSDNRNHEPGGMDRRKGARHPDFNPGSPQYTWFTNNLADAQSKSRFTFVFNHHCPYSRGTHNQSWRTGEDASALPLRVLTETMVRYGVDGWYCGHDELLEHSITNGYEILPDGRRRRHTLSIYDLGGSGDNDVRSSGSQTNPLEYNFMGNYGGNYGFLETDVTTNVNGRWTCTITPIQGSTGNAVAGAQIVYEENPDRGENENDLVYAEYAKTKAIDGVSPTKPSDWVAWERPPEGPVWDETVDVELTEVSAADLTYNGAEQSPRLTVKAGELTVPRDHYTVSTSLSPVRDAREYSVTVTGTGNVRGSKKVPFKVNRAPATVKAKNISMVVGTVPEPQLEVEVTGTFGSDTVIYTELSRKGGSGVGTYAITVTGDAVQGNYDVTFVNGWFTIKEDVIFVDGEDAEIAVDGETAVDVGETAIKVGKVTITGSGNLTIANCQNLTPSSIDLSGLDGTVMYEYASSSANKSLPSGLADEIRKQTNQKVKYAFRGTSAANGWNLGSWDKTVFSTHIVIDAGTHTWSQNNNGVSGNVFGKNGTDENPTLLVKDGAILNFTGKDLSGYQNGFQDGGVIRVNAGGTLNFKQPSGSNPNMNYRQRLVLDPGSLTTFAYGTDKFVLHGAGATPGETATQMTANIYVPASDGTAGPAILRCVSSGGTGLCINNTSNSRGGGCAIYIGENSKLLLDAKVSKGEENDSSSNKRILAKLGPGELEITGEVTSSVDFDARAGIIALPSGQGKFNKSFTAAADVTYRFPAGWENDTAYTLGSGTVNGTAPEADEATVYVGEKKLTGVTLVYSGKTVRYVKPPEPQPIASVAVVADLTYNGAVQTPSVVVTAQDGTTVPPDAYRVSTDPEPVRTARDYTLTVTGTTPLYFGEATTPFAVSRAQATVKADDKSKEFGAEDPEFTATVTGTYGDDTIEYDFTREDGSDYGNYDITPIGDTVQGNYTVTYEKGTLAITKAMPKPAETLTAEITYGMKLSGATVVGKMKHGDTEVAGTFTFVEFNRGPSVTDSGTEYAAVFTPSNTINYASAEVKVKVTVAKRTLTVHAANVSVAYGTDTPAYGYVLSGFVSGESVANVTIRGNPTYTSGYSSALPVGECDVLVATIGTLEADNYSFTVDSTAARLTVTQRTVTVTSLDAEMTYGAEEPEFAAKIDNVVAGEENRIVYGFMREPGDDVRTGGYLITPTGATEQGNYIVRFIAAGRLTINPAKITSAIAPSQEYANRTLTPVVTVYAGEQVVPSDGYSIGTWKWSRSEQTAGSGSTVFKTVGINTATVTGKGNFEGTAKVTFEVTKANYDMSGVIFADQTVVYDGKSHSLKYEGTLPKGVRSESIVSNPVYSGNGKIDVGEYTVAVSFTSGDADHYNPVPPMTAKLTIVPAPITSATATHQTYAGKPLTPDVTVKAGSLDVGKSFTVDEWDGNLMDAGTYLGKVSGTGNFTGTVDVVEFTIDPAQLTAATAEEQVYDGTVKTPVLKVWAGSLAVDTYDLGSWSGGLVSAGTYTAEVSGTGNFTGSQTVTFTIAKATYDLSGVGFAGETVTYNGEAHSLAIEGDLPTGVSVRYEGNAQTDAGTYTVMAMFDGDGDNYEPIADKTAKLTIKKVSLTSATAAAATYTGKFQTPKLTVKAGELTLQPGDYTISGWNATPKDAGTYKATVTGTGNFTDSVGLEFTISPAPLTVTADDQGVGAGEDPPPFTVSYSGFVNGEGEDKLIGTLGFTCAYNPAEATVGQTFEIVPGGLTAANYAITFEPGTLTVGKSTPRIKSLTADEITYGETLASSALRGEAQDAMENPVAGTFVWTDASIAPTVAESGTSYDVTFTPDDTESYTVAHFHATVTVNPAELTVAVSNATAVYGAAAPKFGCEITGFIEGEDESVVSGARRLTCSYKPFDNAGTYAITPDLSTFEADNYTFTSIPGTLTVSKATLTVSAKDLTVTYCDVPPKYVATYSGFLGRDTASVVSGTADLWCAYQQGDKIGPYDIAVSNVLGLSAANYDFVASETPGKLTVGRKSVTVTADNKEKSYGAADPELTATVTGTVGEDTVVYDLAVNYKGASPQEASVGKYVITASGAADQGNYTVAYKSGTMEVKQASLIGENLAATIEYGQRLGDAKVTGVVKSASRAWGPSVSVAGTFTFKEPDRPLTVEESGPYTATFTPENTWAYKPADLTVFVTVTRKKLAVKAVDEEIVYGDVPPAEHACTITGFIDGEDESVVSGDCGYTCEYVQFGDVSKYPIAVDLGGLSAENYFFAAAETSGRLTVRPKTLTVKAVDKAITYGDAPPADHVCEITGFVDGEDESVVSGDCGYTCEYVQFDAVGKYPIAVDLGDLSASNYVFAAAETPGQLTVSPAKITSAAAASQTFTGERLNPVMTVKAGDLTLQSGDYTVSDWSGDLTDAGTYTATVTGTGNFTGTAEVTFEVTEADYDMSGVTFEDDVVTYDGKVHALAIGGELPAGVTVEYDVGGETEAGEYTVTATFRGDSNHKAIAERTATLTINKAKLTSATAEAAFYDGTVKTPVLTVLSGALEVKTYALGDWNGEPKNVGSYMATVTGTGNFEGDVTVLFTIRRATITEATAASQTFTGERLNPVMTVKAGDLTLQSGDYTVSNWSGGLRDAGTYTATVTGTGNFTGTAAVTFEVMEADHDMSGVTFEDGAVTYDGKAHALAIGGELPAGVTVEYDVGGATEAGEYTVTAKFRGDSNHKAIAERTATLTINPAELTSATAEPQMYDGSKKTPVLTVMAGELECATYDLGEWSGNLTDAGTYTATVTGTGNFAGETKVSFTIAANANANPAIELVGGEVVYDGLVHAPTAIVVRDGGRTLVEGVDYEVLRPDGEIRAAGLYVFTLSGCGNYAGWTGSATFRIRGEVIVTIPSRDGLASHVYADGIELQPVGGSGDGVVYAVPATAKVVVEFAADGASGVRIAGGVQRYEINGIDREISFAETGDYRIPVTVDMSVPTVAKPTVNVVIASGSEVFAKKVSGGGSKTAVGKNVTLKATAAKNCVFAGWYLDDGCTCPAADDWLNPSYKYTVIPVPETTLYARFLSMADPEATVLEMEAVSYEYEEELGLLIVPAGEEIAPIRIYVDTLVKPRVTAKNLPSGLKLVQDKVTGEYVIKGKAKKPGELAKPVTLTVKNAVYKKGVVQTLRIIVDNFQDPVAFPDVRDEYDLACGVPAELTIASLMEDAVATVSGLPKGLKFDKQTGMITGTPTKRGTFLVTFKKTLKGPVAKGKHTATARFIVE